MRPVTLLLAPLANAASAPSPFTVDGRGYRSLEAALAAIGDRTATVVIAPGVYRQCAAQTAGVVTFRAARPGSVVFEHRRARTRRGWCCAAAARWTTGSCSAATAATTATASSRARTRRTASTLIAVAAEARIYPTTGLRIYGNTASLAPGAARTVFVSDWAHQPLAIGANRLSGMVPLVRK